MEFYFDKKEVLAVAELLERVLQFQPDFDAALPLGNQLHKFRSELKREIKESAQGSDTGIIILQPSSVKQIYFLENNKKCPLE
jgi:hypothetical protein